MDAQAALAELLELSSQVEAAAIVAPDGAVEASTVTDGARARRLARAGRELLAVAAEVRPEGPAVNRVQVAYPDGSVFAVREGVRTIVAVTVEEPTAGLVIYDLRTALRRLDEEEPSAAEEGREAEAGDA